MNVTLLYDGDSADIREWSNVPYFISETFKEIGCNINRVNMHVKYLQSIYNLLIVKFVKRYFAMSTSYEFSRSKLRGILIDIKLKRVVKKYPDTDLFISISDNFNPYRYTEKRCVMICDWTYEFEIVHDQQKEIDIFEKYYHKKQLQMMKNAYSNIIFRDECRNMLIEKYPNIIVYKKHAIAVQCLLRDIEREKILFQKKVSNKIVFIGAKRYLGGAKVLYKAIKEIKKFNEKVEVYFLGITKEDVVGLDCENESNCYFCGYLDKGKEEEVKLYYRLLTDAKVCINTNEGFVSIAGLTEAGYLYTPVIISKHYQTISRYGEEISCGYYCENDVYKITDAVKSIFAMPWQAYEALCDKCHEFFEDKTWKKLVDEWIKFDFR